MGVQQHLESGHGAQALAQHLRQNPAAALLSVDELSEAFDLPKEFVREVLRGVQDVPKQGRRASGASLGAPFAKAWHALIDGFGFLTAKPLYFIGGTLLAMLILFQIRPALTVRYTGGNLANVTPTAEAAWTMLGLLVLHLMCYYRHARSRVPLHGALVGWALTTPALMITLWSVLQKEKDAVAPMLLALAVAMLLPWAIYAMVGMFVSVLGAYVQIRRVDRLDQRLTRQQLLERLFEIQERLNQRDEDAEDASAPVWERWRGFFQRRPWLIAGLLGFSLHLVAVLLVAGAIALVQQNPAYLSLAAAVQVMVMCSNIIAVAALGYFAGSWRKAVGLAAWFLIWAHPPELIPLYPFGPKLAAQTWFHPVGQLFNFGLVILVASFAHLGALIEERAYKERRLQKKEPAALLAEMVRIQWRLTPSTSNICVLVVDAARSAEMKAAADPLKVEYSFREYQSMLASVAQRHGGEVHNTMGDGAVLAFNSPLDAFQAARVIQTEIERFNREVNRLETPFRLRVGLHSGEVAGELNKVEFTEVIDIAAHVQGAAPIGGIALTEAVYPHLSDQPLAQLQGTIDGCRVFIAMNPTLDA